MLALAKFRSIAPGAGLVCALGMLWAATGSAVAAEPALTTPVDDAAPAVEPTEPVVDAAPAAEAAEPVVRAVAPAVDESVPPVAPSAPSVEPATPPVDTAAPLVDEAARRVDTAVRRVDTAVRRVEEAAEPVRDDAGSTLDGLTSGAGDHGSGAPGDAPIAPAGGDAAGAAGPPAPPAPGTGVLPTSIFHQALAPVGAADETLALAGASTSAASTPVSVARSEAGGRPQSPAPGNGPGSLPSSGGTTGSGGIFFSPFSALLVLLALAAPFFLRRFEEASAFLRPTPFVCALERPG